MRIKSTLFLFYSLFFSITTCTISTGYTRIPERETETFQPLEEIFDSIKKEVKMFRNEFLKSEICEPETIDMHINRFYIDIDLLIWDGFTVTDKTERLKESLQQLPVKENVFFEFLYKQYKFIIPHILVDDDCFLPTF